MDRANISNCDFNEIDIWEEDQLAKCRYAPSYPPKNIMLEVSAYPYIDKRITYIHLATPYDFDREYVAENEPQRHLTRAEATTFYRSRPDLRPCHSDGNPIRLIAPDAPDNPIID